MNSQSTQLFALGRKFFLTSVLALTAACSPSAEVKADLTDEDLAIYQRKLAIRLNNPEARSRMIAKILGSTVEDERHAYLKFHIFGYAGDGNLIPFFTMNNYVVQKWKPGEDATFEVEHYEVGYYSKFDDVEPLTDWENPLTGEVVELPHFVLGPVPRAYGPGLGQNSASFAPDPLNITMIGDRVYVPTLSKFSFPNALSSEEWGPYSSGPTTFWDSMLVYSADVQDVFNSEKTHVAAEMHMQNFVSWAPFLKLGEAPGRTMVRAYGQHISGYDALPANIRANLKEYTPEIFDIDAWTELRMDSIELAQDLAAKRAAGTLDIDQEDYVPFKVKKFNELGE